jgi:hypothetical protein
MGAAWIASAAMGLSSKSDGGGYTLIPIVGPFVAAGVYQTPSCQQFGCLLDFGPALYKAFLITFGIIETTGAALLVSGLVVHRDKLIPGTSLTLMPVPISGQNGNGLGLAGTF